MTGNNFLNLFVFIRVLSLSLFIITSLTAFAQSEVRTYYDSAWQLTTKAYGRYYRLGIIDPNTYKYEGEVKDYFKSGAIEMKGRYQAGVKIDTFFFYYPGGKPKAKGLYWDNKRQGIWTYYHENGKVSDKVYFKDGNFICALECYDELGKPFMVRGTGKWRTRYFDDMLGDSVFIEGEYRDTLPHGVWKSYRVYRIYPNENVSRRGKKLHGVEEYSHGKFVKGKYYAGGEVGRDIWGPTFSILTETEKFKRMESWDISFEGDPTTADYPFLGFLRRPPLSFKDFPYNYPEPTNEEILELLMKIESVFYSPSGRLVTDLKDAPEAVTKRIQFISDSVSDYRMVGLNKAQREAALKFGIGSAPRPFLANEGQDWRKYDFIGRGTELLPTRKFLFCIIDGDEVVFSYWCGGLGVHIHMYYVRLSDLGTMSGFATRSNFETFEKFDKRNKWKKLRSTKWEPLIGNGELLLFEGKIADLGSEI